MTVRNNVKLSIRLPSSMVSEIDTLIEKLDLDLTRSAFIKRAVRRELSTFSYAHRHHKKVKE